ncbi:MAG: ABC transporter ATP-binding protein [Desulfarculaceae bacterium]
MNDQRESGGMNDYEPILKTEGLSKTFGGLQAVWQVDFEIFEGQIIALIGPNGAGKTTFFNLLSGTLTPSTGKLYFKGHDITKLPVHKRTALGLSRTFQKTSLFPELTVFENLRLGSQNGYGRKNACWGDAYGDRKVTEITNELLAMVGFEDKAQAITSNLSHGDQRLLEILLGLSTKPDLLLLDEPAAGLSVKETHQMIRQIKELSQDAISTVIIVEHDMEVVTELASSIYVLHQGQVLCKGSVEQVQCDPQVQDVYFGRAT